MKKEKIIMKKEYGEMKNRWSSESKVEHAHTLPSRERGRANTLKEKIFFPLSCFLLLGLFVSCGLSDKGEGKASSCEADEWALTGFQRVEGVGPIVTPDPEQKFFCPVKKQIVQWESDDTFNPAAVVYNGRVALLYRAEDHSGGGIGTRTSRLGLALSGDGVHFEKNSEPCFYPDVDSQYDAEWPGGCEDPRVVKTEEGLYVMTYTQWNRKVPRLAVATTRDFKTWEKHGLAFGKCHDGRFAEAFSKSASIVTRFTEDGLVAAKVNGKYLMYWGEQFINLAYSDNLTDWEPLLDDNGDFLKLVLPRKGFFDSSLTECGPPALLTEKGILLMYNGRNATDDTCDKNYTPGAYCAGQVLFSSENPTEVLERLDEPFFKPEADFEKSGQYPMGTVFIEGLVYYRDKWFLYYGCADSRVGVAVLDPRQQAIDKLLVPHTLKASNGVSLPYRLMEPEALASGKKYPLVVFLHGAGERGTDNRNQLVHGGQMWMNPQTRKDYPSYVVIPQCPWDAFWAYKTWPASFMPECMPLAPEMPKAYEALKELIDSCRALPQVDASRIYVMGLSMGAMCTYDLCCRFPELFAAAVPICGTVNSARIAASEGIEKIAFSLYHGDADETVPVEGSRKAYRALKEKGASVRLKEFPGCGHGSWNPAFTEPDFLSWLFSQKRK